MSNSQSKQTSTTKKSESESIPSQNEPLSFESIKVDPHYAKVVKETAHEPSQQPFITREDAAVVQATDTRLGLDTGKGSDAAYIQSIADKNERASKMTPVVPELTDTYAMDTTSGDIAKTRRKFKMTFISFYLSWLAGESKFDPDYAEIVKKAADDPNQRPLISKRDAAIVQATDEKRGLYTGRDTEAAKVQSIAAKNERESSIPLESALWNIKRVQVWDL